MKLKFLNTKGAVFVLAAMMVNTGPVLAGALTLTGGTVNSCSSYTGYNADANGNLTVTCGNTDSSSPTAPPTCTLTASSYTISADASSILTANCSPAATSFAWTGPGTSGFTGGGQVSPASTATYTVTGSNGIGAGNTSPSVTVTVSTTAPPPPGPRPIPTSTSPILEIRSWNFVFESLNDLPHNVKAEPVSFMNYYKTLYANKSNIFKLPITW